MTTIQLESVLSRFDSLYPLLAKQRAKQTGTASSQAFISASNQGQKNASTSSECKNGLGLIDRVNLISTIAKSEAVSITTSQQASELSNQILPRIDEICQSTDVKSIINEQGIFMICMLVRLVKFSDASTCREILKILLARAANYLIVRQAEFDQHEEAQDEVSLTEDELLNDQMHLACFVVRKSILKHELAKGQNVTETCNIIKAAHAALSEHNAVVNSAEQLKPSKFAPAALWFIIVRSIYDRINVVNNQGVNPLQEQHELAQCTSELLQATFQTLQLFKSASKYHIQMVSEGTVYMLHGSVVRISQLFGDEVDFMIQFSVAHLTLAPKEESEQKTSHLFRDIICNDSSMNEEQQECFTIMERLSILKKLNKRMQSIPEIYNSNDYWALLKTGIAHLDQAPRKISLTILKENLHLSKEAKQLTSEEEFEALWTTFFDMMDTLESFGSHLIKAVWHRVAVFYDFIQKHEQIYDSKSPLHPLEDFKSWLLVIYERINSSTNMKIRRYVTKETLKRQFVTTNLSTFIFNQYISMLNTGLLFKDLTFYNCFSKNADLVYQFYCNYFQNESKDIQGDLVLLLEGLTSHASHPQVYLIILKVLQTKFGQNNGQALVVFDSKHLGLLEGVIDRWLKDHYFSARYLCLKYIARSIGHYLAPASLARERTQGVDFDWSTLFVVVGNFPIEFFCTRTVFTDVDGIQAAADLIETVGRQELQGAISDYLTALFTTNAMPVQMPKFGVKTEKVLKGLCNMLLILTTKYEDPLIIWFQQFMEPILDSFRQGLSSTYLQHKLVEEKVHCFANLVSRLYEYGSDKLRLCIRERIFLPQISQILSRFNDNLIEPVTRPKFVPSEEERFTAAFPYVKDYSTMLGLAIKMVHLHENRSDNAIEASIKNILQRTLKITVPEQQENNSQPAEEKWLFGQWLLQYTIFEALQAICETYATGINESIKRGVTFFFVPDDLFTIGNSVLHSLITFAPRRRPNGSDELTNEQQNFFEQHSIGLTRINERVSLAQWKVIADMIQVFQHDESIKQELSSVTNKRVADKACDFLDAVTHEFNDVIFRVLRMTYLPTLTLRLADPELDDSVKVDCVEQLQHVLRTCWSLMQDMGPESSLTAISEFVELAFSADLLTSYQTSLSDQMYTSLVTFHGKLFKEIMDFADKYWLLLRTTFNHLMFMFVARPHLMASFEEFIIGFGTCRELRSLDAEIKLYHLQTIIPQVVPSKYEDMSLELINYHGAYIRTMTLLIVEGIVKNHIQALHQGLKSPQLDLTTNALEQILRQLIDIPLQDSRLRKVNCPWGDAHRFGIRIWHFLLVMIQLLDPTIYTPAYRQQRVEQTGLEDIVQVILRNLWEILRGDFIPSLRQYIEIFTVKIILRFPDVALEDPKFSSTLLDPKLHRAQVSASLLIVAGFVLCSNLDTPNAINFKRKIYEQMLGFTTSNSAHSRCVAQYFIMRMQNDKQFGAAFMPSGVQPIIDYLAQSKDAQKMFRRYAKDFDGFERLCLGNDGVDIILSTRINKEGEYVTQPLVETLRTLTTETMCEYRKEDYIPIERKDWWKFEYERRKEEGEFQLVLNEEQTENYQKKILPWEELEGDHEKQKETFMQRQRNDIIMCASLIDKVPNLAGLSRTAEIMNASSLVINNNCYLDTDEFKAISVTSEKWLPIYQVVERDLMDYLAYQKSNGYKVLGLEQTANSKMLHEFDFPSKCILLLGKEKEGIPQEYYGILDHCIEIPQFGIIRSLNVHVSGALCLWEYTKQQLAKKKGALGEAYQGH